MERKFESLSSKRYNLTCAPIEDSDQTVLSMGSQASNVSSYVKLRL